MGTLHGRLPDLHQQILSILRIVCHNVGCHVGCIVGITKQTCFLGANFKYLLDYRFVVVLTRRCESCVTLIHLTAQVAVVGILEQGQTAGCMECEHPFALQTACLRLIGSHGNIGGRDSGEARCVVDHHLPCVGGVEEVFVEHQVEVGHAGVERLEFFLVLDGEACAAADEVLIQQLDGADLLRLESHLVAELIDVLYAGEEQRIHHDLVVSLRVEGICLLADSLHLGR